MSESRRVLSRRKLLADVARGVGASTVVAGFPAIVPSSVLNDDHDPSSASSVQNRSTMCVRMISGNRAR